MRDRDNYAFICADEVGTGGLGNHKHNDISSFHLSIEGAEVVVDPGVSSSTRVTARGVTGFDPQVSTTPS